MDDLIIDGAVGEGGGQILRSSLTLSLLTGRPVHLHSIRAGRRKPGLLRQHLTAVRAATEVGAAQVKGDAIGSREVRFEPTVPARAGEYHFAVGSAGSTTLVLQTVLPALMMADGTSRVSIEGGTHNKAAPPFEFLRDAFLPLLAKMGPVVTATLERPGFYPAGGGLVTFVIEPNGTPLRPLELLERGDVQSRMATAQVSNLDLQIAHRELRVVGRKLSWENHELRAEEIRGADGPGNVLNLRVQSEHVTEVFTGFGEIQKPAEQVAEEAARRVREYLTAGVPVGPHLADQLLLPMAMAGGGSFETMRLTPHTRTNMDIIQRFLPVAFEVEEDGQAMRVKVQRTEGAC